MPLLSQAEGAAASRGCGTLPDGELQKSLEGGTGGLRAVAISDDESVVAAGGDAGVVWLWDAKTGDLLGALGDRRAPVRALVIDRNGELLAVGNDDATVTIWDVESREIVQTGRGHEAACWHSHSVPKASWLALAQMAPSGCGECPSVISRCLQFSGS
jgi:WD40 repeat protein